jgi:predicted secreted protein
MATEARPQAQTKELTLLVAENKSGYFGVHLDQRGPPKPYEAQVWRGDKVVYLGSFATAEEAALCVARSPEGRAAAAKRAAAPAPLTSEEARQQAQAEKLTLLVADNSTGYFGVHLGKPGKPKPHQAQVRRGGKMVHLGYFVTAEEAALCVARSPEGRAAAAERAAAAAPLTSEETRQQAHAERLTLLVAENRSGYFSVYLNNPGHPKPYQAQVKRDGRKVYLGSFAIAEQAALCVARTPEGRAAAAERAAAAVPMTSEEARQQAQAEKLTLLVANNKAGYFGVYLSKPGQPKPHQARVRRRGGKVVTLGMFATAEEAALCVARTPEGQAAAGRAAAADGQSAPSGASLKEEGTVPPMPPGAFVKGEGVVPLMPPDAFVKVEVVVKEEEGPDSRPKRQRAM